MHCLGRIFSFVCCLFVCLCESTRVIRRIKYYSPIAGLIHTPVQKVATMMMKQKQKKSSR